MTEMTFKTYNTLKSFNCNECEKTYNSKQSYQKHLKTNIHKKQVRMNNEGFEEKLYCECCDRTFENKYNMIRHLKCKLHLKNSWRKINVRKPKRTDFNCKCCKKSFKDCYSITRHETSKLHKRTKMKLCLKKLKKEVELMNSSVFVY